MNTKKILAKKAYLTVLERLSATLEEIKRDALNDYRVVGKKSEQAKSWKTGELLWEDEEKTIPRYESEWDYVPIPEEELTDEAKAKVEAIKEIETTLEKLI